MSDDEILSTYIVENTWTCPGCQAVNRGRDVRCPSCGKAKEGNEVETLDPNATVKDPKLLAIAEAGADWKCEYCGSSQRAADGHCAACGGARRREAQVTVDLETGRTAIRGGVAASAPLQHLSETQKHDLKYNPLEIDVGGQLNSPSESPRVSIQQREFSQMLRTVLIYGSFIGGALAVIFFSVWLCTPKALDARVSSMKWIHMVHYEESILTHDSGWSWPAGAFNKDCAQKIRGHHECEPYRCNPHSEQYNCDSYKCNCSVHTSCKNLKNGFSSCSDIKSCDTCYRRCSRTVYSTCYNECPTWDTWCSYDYYKWVSRGDRTTDGNSAENLRWPDIGLQDKTHRTTEVATYIVNFEAKGDTFSLAPGTAPEFRKYSVGQVWSCEKAPIGGLKVLSLKGAK